MFKNLKHAVKPRGLRFGRQLRPFHETMPLNTEIILDEQEARVRDFLVGTARHYGERHDGKVPVLRFAGGWVRDKLMGGESKDIDVAIDCMTGKEFYGFMREFSDSEEPKDPEVKVLGKLAEIKKDAEKSKHLETANTRLFGLELDLVNLRTETYHEDSRNPEMEIGTAEEDALRRDATINALFYNLNTGKVEDFSGKGLEDLESHIIRTPLEPEQTFRDDPLRILRLIRFACRFDFVIEDSARHWMKDTSIHEALELKISRERILVELQKMLQGPRPRRALETIVEHDLFFTIFNIPGVASGFGQNGQFQNSDRKQLHIEETSVVSKVAEILDGILKNTGSDSTIRDQLLSTKHEQYWAWVMCSFLPWIRRASHKAAGDIQASEIARNGLKMDNDTIKVIASAERFSVAHVSEVYHGFSDTKEEPSSPGKRKRVVDNRVTTGLAIRLWGQHWRSIVVTALLVEISRADTADAIRDVTQGYSSWLQFIARETLADVWNSKSFKPVADGGDIMKSVRAKLENVSAGPWMQECVTEVFKYQVQEADHATKEGGLKAVHDAIESGQIRVGLKSAK